MRLDGDRLEKSKWLLSSLDTVVTSGHQVLVVLLELLESLVEVIVELLDFSFELGHFGLELVWLGSPLLHFSELLFRAEVSTVGVRARGAEAGGGELEQSVVVAASGVVLPVAVREVLDGRVPLNAVFTAQALVDCAVNISDNYGLGISEGITQLVPIWFHRLAMASPRSKELNKSSLSGGLFVEVVRGQVDRAGVDASSKSCDGRKNEFHLEKCVGLLGVQGEK